MATVTGSTLVRDLTDLTSISTTGNITVGGTVDGRDVATDGTKLDGIEEFATADQTASEILTAIKTVDGSGTGLDADTVDGIEAAALTQSGDNVALTGDVAGSATVATDGSISVATTIQPNSVELGADTTGNYVASLIAGNLIDLQNNSGENTTPTIDVDLSELTDMTDAAVGADELVILDAGSQKRKAINEITLGLFNTTDQIELGADTTGNYVATVSGTANEIEVTGSGSENAAVTVGLPNDVTVSNNLTVNNDIIQENHRFTSSTITRESTSQVDLDTFSATTYSGAEVNIMAISSGERHITKLLVVHDGTTAYATEYGSVYTNTPLATYDVDISGGNVRIRVTPASATSTVFNTLVTLIEN